ncbi:DUF4329 domain-containing protein, partial [Rahnella sp. PD12R]|uniref:DUF4329 domain-containing protein n=1 Tax=Rahnella sp. PD12R TaxID=2855688 RepID=UPI001C4838F7
ISDVWGNAVDIFNPYKLRQPIKMQGQHYDEESGLHYNRHRYYDPAPGRYITQDPIGLRGGWNLYSYPLNPLNQFDPTGLSPWGDANSGSCEGGLCEVYSFITGPEKFNNEEEAALDALKKINGLSIANNREYAGMIFKDKKNRYFSTKPNEGSRDSSNSLSSPCPAGTDSTGAYHTHGAYDRHYKNEIFSPADINYSSKHNLNGYLGTPEGRFGKMNSKGKDISYSEINTLPTVYEIR